MTRDEVAPDDEIRFAVVGRKIDAVSPAIADLLEDPAEGALVERFAVHDNAVHVKNDCPILCRRWFHERTDLLLLPVGRCRLLDERVRTATLRYADSDWTAPRLRYRSNIGPSDRSTRRSKFPSQSLN